MKTYNSLNINFKVLDGLRGLSAIYVLIHHARLLLTQPYNSGLLIHPEKYLFIDKLLVYAFSFFKFGHEAVIIFFVLSGFVIHLKQADENFNFNNFSSISYLKKRILRIYPTLLTSFMLCLAIDLIIYYFKLQNTDTIFSKYSISAFLLNLFLVPNTPDWGNNFPMWSLKHEWTFYLLYPILLWLQSKSKHAPLIFVIVLYLSYILGFRIPYFNNVAYTFLVWFLGVLLAEIYKKKLIKFLNFLPYLTILLIAYLFINRNNNNLYPILDLVFGLVVMGILSILILNKFKWINNSFEKIAVLGAFSYSIYLLHWPILYLFQKIIIRTSALPYHYWFVIASLFLIIPIVYLLFLLTEKKAMDYKNK